MPKTKLTLLILAIIAIITLGLVYGLPKVRPTNQVNQTPTNTNTSQKPQKPQESQDIDTSNWKTYTNEEYGFSFRYPEEWGVPSFQKSYDENFDTGKRFILSFSNSDNIFLSFFTDDFSEGIGEGTPNYFKIPTNFNLEKGALINNLNKKYPEGSSLDVIDLEKVEITNIQTLKVFENRGYIKYK